MTSRGVVRHVLTGSYHNYFRIYDSETLSDVVLQADKSAFKAKKIGGPLPKNGAKNGARPGGLRDAMQLDTLDFNKKILHASWHPRENTIAVRSVVCFWWLVLMFWSRLLPRTTCSCTARHERDCVTVNLIVFITHPHPHPPSSPLGKGHPSHHKTSTLETGLPSSLLHNPVVFVAVLIRQPPHFPTPIHLLRLRYTMCQAPLPAHFTSDISCATIPF